MLANRIILRQGRVLYNGRTSTECITAGIDVNKAVQYMEQVDIHIPLLTVSETLNFVQSVGCRAHDPARVEEVISDIGLTNCKDTIVGNVMIRGVSGGERRRVSIAEALLSDASVLTLDEYTNGLDTVIAEKITKLLRQWVNRTNGSIVATAQQPTPGLVAMFDNIIVLKDAQVIFHGPREDLLPYFRSMGFNCPDDVDMCDFIVDCVSQPKHAFRRQALMHLQTMNDSEAVANFRTMLETGTFESGKWEWVVGSTPLTPDASIKMAAAPCLTTQAMLTHFQSSVYAQRIHAALATLRAPKDESALREKFPPGYLHSVTQLLGLVLSRQAMLSKRNTSMYIPRILQTIIVAIAGGSVFYMIELEAYYQRIALFFFMMSSFAYIALSELPMALQTASVVYKHAAATMYPPWTHVVSTFLCNVPLLALEVTMLTLIVYFMADNVVEAGAFFMCLAIIFLSALFSNVFFHMLTAVNNTEETAVAIASPSVGILFMCCGLFVTHVNLPNFMIWIYWLSPWSWAMRALVNIEFLSDRYSLPGNSHWGSIILRQFDFHVGRAWVGYGAIYLVGLVVLMLWFQAYLMRRPFFELSRGTRRNTDDEFSSRAASALSTLTADLNFKPAALTFKDLTYTVQVEKDGHTKDKVLLRNICGYAQPGKLTALMGASGAGKTTLLDVLAGQKTHGTVEGSIRISGNDIGPVQRARITGYVEQFDDMCPFLTVEETLMFSANMRLASTVSAAHKEAVVAEIIDILELNDMKHRLIGNADMPSLSPSQLKRVSIGVELVANPSILFLDEPTTGLDAKAALTVMSVVKRIAEAGRTIICTIHQPNAELFYLFDQLVLLAPGGYQVYFGELGTRSGTFTSFLSQAPGVAPLKNQQNPASWMLEQLTVPAEHNPDESEDPNKNLVVLHQEQLSHHFSSSSLLETTQDAIRAMDEQYIENAAENQARVHEMMSRRVPLLMQFSRVFYRTVLSYVRNVKGLVGRFMMMAIVGVLYGLLYFDLTPTTQTSALSALSARANSISFNGISHSLIAVPVFKAARNYVYREHVFGFYTPTIFVLSSFLCEVVLCGIDAIIIQIPLYFMSGFTMTAVAFWRYFFAVLWLDLMVVMSALLSCTLFASPALIGVVQSTYVTISILFAGTTITYDKAPRGWLWAFYVSPFGRSTEAIAVSQFDYCSPMPDCGDTIAVLNGSEFVQVHVPRYISSYLGWDYGGYWAAVGTMCGWTAFFTIVSCFTMHFLTHRNK